MNLNFFELLQIATGNRIEFSHTPTEEEWQELFSLSQKQALTGVAFLGIERLPQEQRPYKELLMQWIVATEQIKEKNHVLDKQAIKVVSRFLKDGFRSVVLKGQGIATLYAHGRYRTPGDIDIWLEGSREKVMHYVKGFCPNAKIVYHHTDFLPIGNTEVEVHFTPSWMNSYFTNRTLQKFFEAQKKVLFSEKSDNANEIPMPSLCFNRVYILVHIYRHLFGEGIGLRQMMDYYYVLCQGFTEEEGKETLAVLKSLKMLRFASAVMWLLQTVFGMKNEYLLTLPNEKEGRFLLNEIMMAGNFGQHDTRIKYDANASDLSLFFCRVGRNFRFIRSYPSEVLWSPLFKIWHYFWRKCI